MKQIYDIAPPGLRKTTVADNGGALNVIFLGRTDTLDDLQPVVKDLEGGINPPPGISVAPGGIATVGVGLIQNLEKSRVQLTYLALLFVGAFLTIRLRSLIRALLSLVPVLVAVGAVSLIAVGFGLKLSPVTAVAGPLVVAVCTEFTSLILLRFVEERARGLAPREAMDATARRTGRAFMVSGMTAVAGVATLGLSSMPLLSEFGVIVAINVSVALFSALVVLPPILVWADGHNWVSRGLLKNKPQPYQTLEEELAQIQSAFHPQAAAGGNGPVSQAQTVGAYAAPSQAAPPYPGAATPVTAAPIPVTAAPSHPQVAAPVHAQVPVQAQAPSPFVAQAPVQAAPPPPAAPVTAAQVAAPPPPPPAPVAAAPAPPAPPVTAPHVAAPPPPPPPPAPAPAPTPAPVSAAPATNNSHPPEPAAAPQGLWAVPPDSAG